MSIDPIRSQRIIERGTRAGAELGCCSCEDTNCTILTTSMVAGGIIGGCLGSPVGIIPGVSLGFGAGLAFVAIKESIDRGECVIL